VVVVLVVMVMVMVTTRTKSGCLAAARYVGYRQWKESRRVGGGGGGGAALVDTAVPRRNFGSPSVCFVEAQIGLRLWRRWVQLVVLR
jgi:hypothetical protein